MKNAEESGVPYADLVCTNADVLATLVSSGYLKNLYSIPHLDLNAGYVGPKLVEAQTVNNSLYMLSSGMTMNTSDLWAVYYDKQLLAEAGFDPVQMVEDGTWTETYDVLIAEIKACIEAKAAEIRAEVEAAYAAVIAEIEAAIAELEGKMEFRRSEIAKMQEYYWESYNEYD